MPQEFFITTLILLVAAACIGTILVLFRRSQHFDIDKTRRLQEKLDDAARQIEKQKQKMIQMASSARTDPLTQLPNEQALDEELTRRAAEVTRYDLRVCLVMIDLDHFKEINDQHGIPVGDGVLQHLAEIIRSQTRACDFSARIGGNRFAVVLGHTQLENAHLVADRLKQAVESIEFKTDHARQMDLEVSAGVAELTADPQLSVRQAAQALAQAKTNGRNCVVVFGRNSESILAGSSPA